MNRKLNIIASIGLGIGVVFGISGSIFTDPVELQNSLYEISSVGLTAACALLTIKFLKRNHEFIAGGFLIFAIGEAVMSAGTAAGNVAGQSEFAAGMALYLPSLLLISLPKGFPIWARLTGVASVIPFTIAAAMIYMGDQVLSTSALPGAGYGLLSLTMIGWIWSLLRERSENADTIDEFDPPPAMNM